MSYIVIDPPVLVVSADQARAARVFSAADDDAYIESQLRTAQLSIDGPGGWLGRAIGEQVLELQIDRLGCPADDGPIGLLPPVSEVLSVISEDPDGVSRIIDPAQYALQARWSLWPRRGFAWPSMCGALLRVRFRAGEAADHVPAPIAHAIMLMARELSLVSPAEGHVRREDVAGLGSVEYGMPDIAARLLRGATERLLAPYRVYA